MLYAETFEFNLLNKKKNYTIWNLANMFHIITSIKKHNDKTKINW